MKKTAEPLIGIKRIARIILLSLFFIALITVLLHNNPITAIKTMIKGYGDFNNVTSEEERSAQKIIDDGLQDYDNAEKELDRILADIELSGGVQTQKNTNSFSAVMKPVYIALCTVVIFIYIVIIILIFLISKALLKLVMTKPDKAKSKDELDGGEESR